MRKPPLIAFLLLKTFVPSGIREFYIGDIEEQFQTIAMEQDGQKANRWFWKQLMNSIVPLLGLFAQKNLQLSVLRVAAIFVVLLPVIATSPLKSSGLYFSLGELLGVLLAALVLGFLCRLIIRNVRFISIITITLVIFTICLVIRGEWRELPWMLIPLTIFISVGAGLALIIPNLNSTDPKIKA